MMRTLSLFVLSLLGAALSASGQSLEAFKEQLARPSVSQVQPDGAQVTVRECGDAARVVAAAARSNGKLRLRGYRVCIFFDNGQHARADAQAACTLFSETFPGIKAYMVYENPYFKVSVGDCLTAEEAIILKGRVSTAFPKAFLKSEELTLSDLLD